MMSRSVGRSLDDTFQLLSADARRQLLFALLEREPLDPEAAVTPGAGGIEDAREARIKLRHVHLPKLEAAGFLAWDREAGEIRRGPEFEEVSRLLELLDEHDDRFTNT